MVALGGGVGVSYERGNPVWVRLGLRELLRLGRLEDGFGLWRTGCEEIVQEERAVCHYRGTSPTRKRPPP